MGSGCKYREGILRAVGVCNFDSARLTDLCLNHPVTPAVNQIEIHPFFQQQSALHTMNEYHVQPEAWGPLSEGQRDIFHNKLLAKIAWKYHKSVAQIVLRWHVQRGVVVIPKSSKKNRMEENIHIWDFQLTQEDMKQIAGMDIGHSEIINHYLSCTAKALNRTKIHD